MNKYYSKKQIMSLLLCMAIALPYIQLHSQGRKKKRSNNVAEIMKSKPKRVRTFRVDFRNKDIQDFLKAMSAIIGKNIITDDKIVGKITVISPKRLPVTKAFSYLTSVLAVKGFGVVEEGNLLKVISMKDAVAKGQEIHIGRIPFKVDKLEKDRIVTHIIQLVGSTKASRLAGILKRATNQKTEIIDYDESSTLIITGGAYEVNRLVKIIVKIDIEEEDEVIETSDNLGNIQIYRVENLEADKIEATLRRIPFPSKTTNGKGKKNTAKRASTGKTIDVFSHKESNSIIFIGTEKEFEPIKKLIKRIDIQRDQVLLEVLIAEIKAQDTNSFGIDWRLQSPHAQFNSNLAVEGSVFDSKGDITGINTLLGFSLGYIDSASQSVLAILNANINNQNFSVLSAPQVLTLDNQEAEINVGQDIPIISSNRVSGASDQTVNISNYEYRPTGVKLKFTPQINKNKMITLKLYQEIKSALSTGDATQNPTFTKRDLKTTIRVKDNQTVVIGGLISTDKKKSVRKIPLLGDLPFIGYLFKRTSTDLQRTNLLIFITPHILTSKTIADRVTEELKKDQLNEYNMQEEKVR